MSTARRRGGAGTSPAAARRSVLLASLGAAGAAVLAACGRAAPAGDTTPAPPPASTPSTSGSQAVPGGTVGLGIVGIFVADLERSLTFYRDLGLAIPDGVDTTTGALRLTLPSGLIFFWETFAYTRRDFPGYSPAVGDRKVALEFGFASAGELDAKYAELVDAGAPGYFPPTQWGAVRYAVLIDPDGNQVALRHPYSS